MSLVWKFEPRRVIVAGCGITAILFALHLVSSIAWQRYGVDGRGLGSRFHLGTDSALPTWISAALLSACAISLALIAWTSPRVDPRNLWSWRALAVIFVLMSVDEVGTFHEWLGEAFSVDSDIGYFYYGWVIFGIAAVVLAAVLFLPFLRRLDARTRNWFLLGGALYVGGALVMEMFNASLYSSSETYTLRYDIQTGIEEVFELIGTVVFLAALTDVLQRRETRVAISSGASVSGAGTAGVPSTSSSQPT